MSASIIRQTLLSVQGTSEFIKQSEDQTDAILKLCYKHLRLKFLSNIIKSGVTPVQ